CKQSGETPREDGSMRGSAPSLAPHCRRTIVSAVPQRPRNFEIASVDVRPVDGSHPVPTGPGAAAPSRFIADVILAVPDLRVEVGINVAAGGEPSVAVLAIFPTASTPLTSGVLRKILMDQIVRAAVAEASQP